MYRTFNRDMTVVSQPLSAKEQHQAPGIVCSWPIEKFSWDICYCVTHWDTTRVKVHELGRQSITIWEESSLGIKLVPLLPSKEQAPSS